jgi:hypothetical protein
MHIDLGPRFLQVEGLLTSHGGWLAGYLPDDSFLAVGPDSAAAALQQLRSVAWVGSPHPTDKLPAVWVETTQWLSVHALATGKRRHLQKRCHAQPPTSARVEEARLGGV